LRRTPTRDILPLPMDPRAAQQILDLIRRDGEILARRFGLRYRAIEAESPRVRRRYGVCFADGTIRIRLRHAVTGEPLKYSSLVSTLCHELAHLRHFNHGLRFQRLYAQILGYARDRQIYRPGPASDRASDPVPRRARVAAPPRLASREAPPDEGERQLSLFGGLASGV
jgi:YgjP-like, metallopeptidase domain